MTGGYYDGTDREMRTRVLQRMLMALADTDIRETGQYDEATRAAVREFQRTRGYPVTGIADRRTWEEMSRLYRDRTSDFAAEGIRPFVGRERRIYRRPFGHCAWHIRNSRIISYSFLCSGGSCYPDF